MKKKLLLFFSMLVVALNAGAWSNGQSFTADGFTFVVKDADNRIARITSSAASTVIDGSVTFPATVADPRDPNMFFSINEVEIASWNGSYLGGNPTSVILPEGYTTMMLRGTSAKNLTLPSTLTSINFWGDISSYQSFSFPNGNNTFKFDDEAGALMSKDGKTYWYHVRVKTPADGNVIVPEGVENIQYCAFYEDPKVKNIHLPSTLKEINMGGDYPLTGANHTSFTVADGNPYVKVVDGVLYTKRSDGKYNLRYYPRGKQETTYVVPEDVTAIGSRAFTNNYVTNLVLHDGISYIGSAGLVGTGVTSITVPASLSNMNGDTFVGLGNVANITIPESHPNYKSVDGVVFSKDGKNLIFCPTGKTGDFEIPAGVTKISDRAFRGSKLSTVKANAELAIVGDNAFIKNNIASIDFSAVTGNLSIYGYAFYRTDGLSQLTIPASTIAIGNNALQETHASKIIIPNGSKLSSVGSNLLHMSGVKEVEFQGTCDLTTVSTGMFANSYYLENVNLPSNIKVIGDRAFQNCRALTSITLPDDLEEIGSTVFDGCTHLTEINFPANSKLKTIKRNAFDGAPITSLTLTEGVEKIEAEAFIGCDALTSIDIPASLTDLSPEAFKFCNNLTAINVAEDNPVYASVDGILMSKDLKTVLSFPAGKVNMSTLLPPTVEKIGDYAFYANDQLTNITLPAKVTEIGERAFGLCSNLDNITFLGSTKMDPAGISTGANKNAFDDGAAGNITLNVRAAVESTYEADPFYSTFAGVTPSTKVGHEEYIPMSATAAMLLSTDATDKVYKIPSTIAGLAVANIGDNAFDNVSSSVYEVIVPATVTDLGFQAFKNSGVTNIYFLGDAVKVATEKYGYPNTDNEFNANQNIYVKRSQLDAAKTNMARFDSQITNEIPYAAPTADFGTFSREFATDFSQGGTNTVASPKFIAFNTISGKETKGDTDVFIIESINAGGADGTYIPANTGVIFKKYGTAPTYYEIADNQTASPVATFVVPVLEETTVSPGVGVQHYYIGKNDGKAHLITSAITIGAHKAYLKVTASSPAKKVAFRFSDSDDSATGINEIETASEKSEAIYNLNGQRVNGSVRGIVIRGGKKYINQ